MASLKTNAAITCKDGTSGIREFVSYIGMGTDNVFLGT
jgi:hypothetical protein